MAVELRFQKISDAERFYKILNNPNFIYFTSKPKTIEDEERWIKSTDKKRKENFEHNYAIIYGGKLVGGCGIKIDQHRKYIGEIGYFLDEDYWGKGIVSEAVKLLENIGFNELGLKRIEIWMDPMNKASEKVALKNGYEKEGLMKKAVLNKGEYTDSFLYAKVK